MMSSIYLMEMHIREALLDVAPTLNIHNLQQAMIIIII